jgi:hypothetical protein
MTTEERDRYEDLVLADMDEDSCATPVDTVPNPTFTTADGTPITTPTLGDFATVTLGCDFDPITPLGDIFFGSPIAMSATSTFPIREGCVNCPEVEPDPPPAAPIQCRAVPEMHGMSVAGARLAWESAGFNPERFTGASGDETSTVDVSAVTENDPLSTCEMPAFAIFSSSVLVTVLAEDTGSGCEVVPNLIGVTLSDAVSTWGNSPFTGPLTADGGDPSIPDPTSVVAGQVTSPTSTAGVSCIDPAASIDVQVGPPWPAPPPAPCRVPNLINLTRAEGEADWVEAGFLLGNYSPSSGVFKIKEQSLVGGTYVPCGASIVVSPPGKPGG